MVIVGFGNTDRIAMVIVDFDRSRTAVGSILYERNLVRDFFFFRLIDLISSFQDQKTIIIQRTGITVKSSRLRTGIRIRTIKRANRICDKLTGICRRRLSVDTDREESRSPPAVSHRYFFDGKTRLVRLIHNIETGSQTGQFEV